MDTHMRLQLHVYH